MPRRQGGVRLLLAAVLLAAAGSCARGPADEPVSLAGATMGTTYSVKLVVPDQTLDPDRLHQQIDQVLTVINRQMSTYLDDSEVSRFNRWERTDWFSVSLQTAIVVGEAQKVAQQTGGSLDITVGPLVDLWSFGPVDRPKQVPSEQEIAAALERVGYQQVEVQYDPPALRKENPDVAIDLSALAKGYAVDQVAELLEDHQVPSYLVEIGGEVRAKGRKPDGAPWHIGVERPTIEGREIQLVLALDDGALASSGDYRNFFIWQGQRYSHEIDPRTGFPTRDPLAAVSVLSNNAMRADALATALLVMGSDEARRCAERLELDVLLIARQGEKFQSWMTPGFARHVAAGPFRRGGKL